MDFNLFDEREIKNETSNHITFLNSVVGLGTFTLGLTCLAFDNPQRIAMVCIIVILTLCYQASRKFPPTLTALRDLEKETKNIHVKEARKYIEARYYGFKSLLTKATLFCVGLGFYLAVLVSPEFTTWLKFGS